MPAPCTESGTPHTESCIDCAFSLAEENHRDATGEDIYALQIIDYSGEGRRTFGQACTELRAVGIDYLTGGLLDCSCEEDAAWYAEHGRPS
jgi:hypothetical protein